ncbi:5,6-dimethylbenzimidazole synthase [Cochlodiniinecator piscidefendens]|uniref:5,6-dimethylbenzimidazole synthase n=1 Tax=Cochlodiniinecator piscidefendens TaxID=2715756 RepID=UPI001407583E|nr:5,6-dimethylbenzimidazole synthase [Cochlodiniinecator piscidefendens]
MTSFSETFRQELDQLMRWRRDVRHFRTDPIEDDLIDRCLATFNLAPSVGLSEPWRVVRLNSETARASALANYEHANTQALNGYSGDKAKIYANLKLSGMRDAPVQFAVFCDDETEKGAGLGAGTMPEMRRYSVVAAITQFWLSARAEGLGVGWVSILDPDRLCQDLNVPDQWSLVGYLCVGWPESDEQTPELERAGWENRNLSLPVVER